MKRLSELSWQVDEKTYRKDKSYSQSLIGKFNREGFDSLSTLFDHIDTPQLRFGSLVDCIVTGTKEEFDSRYFIVDFPKTTESLENIARELFNRYNKVYKSFNEIPDEVLNKTGIECDYYANPRYDEKRLKLIKTNCAQIYDLMFLAKGKECVSTEDMNKAMRCVNALKSHELIGKYLAKDSFAYPGIEHYYQLKFKIEDNGIPLKCMADLLTVNHNNKTVQPFDLKTTGHPEHQFHKSFIRWGYWIQAQLYWYIIRKIMDADEQYKDYELLDYKFLVVYTENPNPLVWTYRDTKCKDDLYYGKNGNIVCRNWRNIVNELDYYIKNNLVHPININDDNDIIEWLNKE